MEINYKEINIKEVIDELIVEDKIDAIYLFGSRAYKTGSTRSDVDFMVLSKQPIPQPFLFRIHNKYKYADIFYGDKTCIYSIVNGSIINKRRIFISLIKQLNAICLWDKKNKYQNTDFYDQYILDNQTFSPSIMSGTSSLLDFKHNLNNTSLSEEARLYLNESIGSLNSDHYLAFVSLFGCGVEKILIDFCDAYKKRYSKFASADEMNTFNNTCSGVSLAKKRLNKIEELITDDKKNNSTYFKKNGLGKIDEAFIIFDVIRNYRNDVDHPSGCSISKADCNALILAFNNKFDMIMEAINVFNNSPV